MDSTEIAYEHLPYLRGHTDGRIERLVDTDTVPPSMEFLGRVLSKDVPILPELGVSARIFTSKLTKPPHKYPLLLYFHGGAFCSASPFCAKYHDHLHALVFAAGGVVAVAVDYRKAPEHPIPAAYQDSWAALHWALAHRGGDGPEFWLNQYADFEKVYLAGDGAGANIAHNLALKAGHPRYKIDPEIRGLALVHPFFSGSEGLDPGSDRVWKFACPDTDGSDDPRVNPVARGGTGLAELGCGRVLVCVAGDDALRDRGREYYEELGRSGWAGEAEFVETEGEGAGFHLDRSRWEEKGRDLVKRLAGFFNGG